MSTVELRGVTMHLYEHEAVSDAIRERGDFYEADILDDLRERHPRQRLIVDVGAHIGNHSLYWSVFVPNEGIVAIEPVPDNFALLSANLETADCYRMALSDAPGTLRMRVDDVNRGRCTVAGDGTLEVSATTLDALELGWVSLLKVDVEGHQAKVLEGARATLSRAHPAVLVEDEEATAAPVLAQLGYRHVAEWPGANHLWEWA